MKYKIYGIVHKTAKKILKKSNDLPHMLRLVSFPALKDSNEVYDISVGEYVNEICVGVEGIKQKDVYPIENLIDTGRHSKYQNSFQKRKGKLHFANLISEAVVLWPQFLEASVIPRGYRNEGIHYAGYIKEYQQWCLPSWIWTNAALVRYYCASGQIEKAKKLGDQIILKQQPCGGWIVRNDYTRNGVSPQLAPNDSCYIALNCCLALYEVTKDHKYLDSAVKNAIWTEMTARPDGMVWFAYDIMRQKWIKNNNIVDTGFTAGLFSKLYEITGEEHYLIFLKRFVSAYIKMFYMPEFRCFSTAIDGNDKQYGGAFGRGQGWALEGLIPAYRVLKDETIKDVIECTISSLLRLQLKNGGWSYNLLKPMMGEDCKAVPVIAKCLLDWYMIDNTRVDLKIAARKALVWCAKHTMLNGDAAGGIFSYTIEGAVVHHKYTNTAFVYGGSYALEVKDLLEKLK